MQKLRVSTPQKSTEHEIIIGAGLISDFGLLIRESLPNSAKKIAIISNRKVFGLYGEAVKTAIERAGFSTVVFLMADGERYKNFNTLRRIIDFLSENKLRRTDHVVALGGGVVGDIAGFAASIYLRGISIFQIPTTLLAMIDSSVGGKTGIDTKFGKNLVGTFHQPLAVFIDVNFLRTLPRREFISGLCEAIKHSVLSGTQLFKETISFLSEFPASRHNRVFSSDDYLKTLEKLIASNIAFKSSIVSEDEREETNRTERSRKILNFGHTIAHAIEKSTKYSLLKHGEAVGIGILVEAEISKFVANFPESEIKLLSDVIGRLGKFPNLEKIEEQKVIEAISFDKKNLGGELEWVLLRRIGEPFIFKGVSEDVLVKAFRKIVKKE
ncbi:MAG: 3-dehydroquinate synthase [Acidobacteria bacterium]|nr:MAG: 3-dehydroquinate synthase [Acidobacteriota bacterium]